MTSPPIGSQWRRKDGRSGLYTVLFKGMSLVAPGEVVIATDPHGNLWVCPVAQFMDGRHVRSGASAEISATPFGKEEIINSMSDYKGRICDLMQRLCLLAGVYGIESIIRVDAGANNVDFMVEPREDTNG